MKDRSTRAHGALEVFVFPFRPLPAIFVCSLVVSGAFAQGSSALRESPRTAQVRALNNSVLQLHGQIQQDTASAGAVRGQAGTVLAQRAAALQTLVQQDPRAALTFAFSPDLLADLAEKFPGSALLLESHVTLSGTVEHWIADSADIKSSKESWFLNTGGSRLELHFAAPQRPGPNSNPTVTVEGVRIGSHVAVSKVTSTLLSSLFVIPNGVFAARNLSSLAALLLVGLLVATARKLAVRAVHPGVPTALRQISAYGIALLVAVCHPLTASAQTCSATGVQNTLILLVNIPNGALPTGITAPAMQDVFFGTNSAGPSMDGFLRVASYGQTSAAGAVYGPYNLTGSYATCQDVGNGILNDAVSAAKAAGVNLSTYSRLFIVFNDILGCGWAGYTQVGSAGCSLTTSSGTFNTTVVYMDANYLAQRANAVSLVAHELGHDFGLLHSGTLAPTNATDVIGPLATPGAENDMGDYWSVMGEVVLWLYPGPQKANILGWFPNVTNVQTVASTGTFTLHPLDTPSGDLQLLKIQRGTANPGYYLWIEYRQPVTSYNSSVSDPAYSGALIRYQDPTTNAAHTYLPNFTPSVSNGNSPPLAVGQTWKDPYTDLSISALSASSTGLTITVNYSGAPSCVTANPALSISPLNPSLSPGQSTTYAVSVTDNDSNVCAAGTFNFASSEPSGWTTSFSSSFLTLSPGQTGTFTVIKTAPAGVATGTYAVNVSASDSASSATATANVTVTTASILAATVSVSGTNFAVPGTVPITATVVSAGLPASGASVTFSMTAPDGSTTTQSATTGSNGVAAWIYKLNSKSPLGNYRVNAQASAGSSGSGGKRTANTSGAPAVSSNTATFRVQ